MNELTIIDPLPPKPRRKSRPWKSRRTLAWFLIGLGLKLAITAIVFAGIADREQASTRSATHAHSA